MWSQNRAIILSNCGHIENTLYYEEVYKLRDCITEFISKNITDEHQCLGLRMIHNIYIPSIVLSLQKLEHAFIFLPIEESDSESIIQELNINWVLSFGICKKSTAVFTLNHHSLNLEYIIHNNEITMYEKVSYIVRTSGTTGENKFVQVGKYSIESNIKCLSKIFNVNTNDLIYFGTPLTFDPSMVELLLAIHNGACLLITEPKNVINPHNLYKTLFDSVNCITILQIVPSIFQRWSRNEIANILQCKSLKILAFGGECFPAEIVKYNKSDSLKIFNLYGITEVSCWASVCEISDTTDEISIGDPLDDTLIELRDESGNQITNGEGEIYIGSNTRICWVNKESQFSKEAVFRPTGDIAVIDNNRIVYKRRKNDVFKRLGHKIHLSKIEELVYKETDIQTKCVWLKSESKLLLFLIIENLDNASKDKVLDKIRIKLLHKLPKQYFPDYIDIVRKCPVTSHGKTDKTTLETIYHNRNYKKQKQVIDIFKSMICRYFGVSTSEITGKLQNATFFEIGGNSILAVQFLHELEEKVGMDCPELVTALFEKRLNDCLKSTKFMDFSKKRRSHFKDDHITTLKRIKSDIEFKIAWTYNLEACVDASPLIFESRGKLLVAIGSFSHIFTVLDANSGTEVAKFILPNVIEACSCLSPCCNFLYVGCFDGYMYCLDFMAGAIKWTYLTDDRIKCTPVLCHQETGIVFGSYDKHIHCIRILDGSLIWKIYVGESIVSTPLLEKNNIYVAGICGTCICISEISGEILWKYNSNSPIFGAPCFLKNTILWPNVRGNVICLNTSGIKIHEVECKGHLYSSLITYNQSVIFSCHSGSLYHLEMTTDLPKLKTIVSMTDALSTPCVCEEYLVVASTTGCLFLINWQGELLTDLKCPAEIFSWPKLYKEKVYVGCRDNNLYCIEITNKSSVQICLSVSCKTD